MEGELPEDGGEQQTTASNGGTADAAETGNNLGLIQSGLGGPEEVPSDDGVDFSELLAELQMDIDEFSDPELRVDGAAPPEYWDAVARKEVVEFLDFWVNGNDSTVAMIAEAYGIDGVPVSEYFMDVVASDAPLAGTAEQYLELRDGLAGIRDRVENNTADSLLGIPIPNPAGALKWIGRRLGTTVGRNAMLSRIRRAVAERINKLRRARALRCQSRSRQPVFFDTGAVFQEDPQFSVPGLFNILITSQYQSDLNITGPLGWGRVSDLDASLERLPDSKLRYRDGAGFHVDFNRPTPNPGQWNPGDHIRFMEIAAGRDRTFMVREEGVIQHFRKQTDTTWVLAAVEDRNGLLLEYERDDQGLLEAIETPEGLRLEFTNDAARGLRTSVTLVGTDGTRREVMRYAYDSNDNLTLAECPYGDKHEYRYDDAHRRIWFRKNDQYEGRYTFDDEGRCVLEETNGPYNGTRFEYDPERRITKHIPGGDPERTEVLYYDEDGAVFAEAHISGRFKRTYYDETGYTAAEQDGNGHRTQFRYDYEGRITSIQDAEGRISDFRWTEHGEMEFAIDPSGATWESDFDENGNLVGTIDALGHRTDINVNEFGQPVGICRHDGFIQGLTYSDNHWLVSRVDFDGRETRVERDSFGRVVQVEQDGGDRSSYAYEDQEGADFWTPSQVTLADGTTIQSKVLTPRRQILHIDGGGRETEFTVDAFGKIEATKDARGSTLAFRYDHAEELEEVENQTGQTWRFERDGMGRIVREIDFGGAEITYEYDEADRLIGSIYPDGTVHHIGLDDSGLMIAEIVEAPGEDPITVEYEHDERGLLSSASTGDSTVSFERDANGRVIAEVINGVRIDSTYDCCGRRTERVIGEDRVVYDYDPVGRLSGVQIADHDLLRIARDDRGLETQRGSSLGFALQQKFNAIGLMLSQTMAPGTNGGIDRSYSWGPSIEPLAIKDGRWGGTGYSYDANGQIARTQLGDGGAETFEYDARLNISSSAYLPPAAAAAQGIVGQLQSWSAGSDGRVETASGPEGEKVVLTYDAKGRVTEKTVTRNGFRPQTWRFTWNGLDRMVAAHTPDGAKWTYGYDAFARRLWKQEWTRETQRRPGGYAEIAWQHGARHEFVWDGDVIASETILAAGQTRQVHWYFEPDTFVPLARREGAALSFVVTDHLGTPREVVSETGTLEWAAEYRTWGRVHRLWRPGREMGAEAPPEFGSRFGTDGALALAAPDPDPAFCPLRFQGQWADAETGLHYNRFRYYEPMVGGYVSPDPIGLRGGPSLFAYASTPARLVDPFGLQTLNASGAATDRVLYTIFVNGEVFKYGIADATRRTQSSGLPTRLHQQLRMLRQCYGQANVTATQVNLGRITKRCAEIREQQVIAAHTVANGGQVPPGNSRSFPGIPTVADNCLDGNPMPANHARQTGAYLGP